jgi:transcription elongation factor
MSTQLLVVLTVIEIVALVAVLALFIIAITRRLRAVGSALEQVSGGVISAIQGNVFLVGAGSSILNNQLDAIAAMLPAVAEKAESLPSQKSQASQPQSQGRDPVIGKR